MATLDRVQIFFLSNNSLEFQYLDFAGCLKIRPMEDSSGQSFFRADFCTAFAFPQAKGELSLI